MIFKKKKYHFNPVTLTYEEIKISKGRRFFTIFSALFFTLGIVALAVTFLNRHIDSPETILLRENLEALSGEMEELLDEGTRIRKSCKTMCLPGITPTVWFFKWIPSVKENFCLISMRGSARSIS